jgi:polyisoprenoid-binding protein YceI
MKRLLAVTAMLLSAAAAPAQTSAWRVARADVRVVCPLTVGGSFEARTAALTGTLQAPAPGSPDVPGTLQVDLRTLQTGIDLRDQHLREKYLEVEHGEGYGTALLTGIHTHGLDPQTATGRGTFQGTLTVHGVAHDVSGSAVVRREGEAVKVDVAFPVSLDAHHVEAPRYLGVGVRDQVTVKAEITLTPEGGR